MKFNISQSQKMILARAGKKDEFYTRLKDIESELKHYSVHFAGKTVYCNCDDYRVSNFAKYFYDNFERLCLKELIVSCYKGRELDLFEENTYEPAVWLKYDGVKKETGEFSGDGDFRSEECIELLKQSDIVVTNPPFSLFREFVGQLVEYDKKFLIIGNQNAIAYKGIFQCFKEDKIWFGQSGMNCIIAFKVPDDYSAGNRDTLIEEDGVQWRMIGFTCWYTNLDYDKDNEDLVLQCSYSPEAYPKYDNYDAINVNKVADIPFDYDGVMGVPITFLDKYNPEQFEILGLDCYMEDNPRPGKRFELNGKATYARVLIKRRRRKQ